MESVVIHADFGGYRLLSVARLLEISLQRTQHLVGANYTFFWQLIPPLPAGRPEIYIARDHIEACAWRSDKQRPACQGPQTLNRPAQLLFASISRDVSGPDVFLRTHGSSIRPARLSSKALPPLTAMEHICVRPRDRVEDGGQ